METTIRFTVNGQSRSVTCDSLRPLLEVLREDLQLTGTKYGCGEGRCGACTVLVSGAATQSCITPVGDIEGEEIVTIEALAASDKLHPMQEAFIAERAMQCGFCTPGMIMQAVGLLENEADPTEERIVSAMGDHICRCGTYPRIVRAIRRAAAQMGRNQ